MAEIRGSMNCDVCRFYDWYYDWCDKWNCKIDSRAVQSCFEVHEETTDKLQITASGGGIGRRLQSVRP